MEHSNMTTEFFYSKLKFRRYKRLFINNRYFILQFIQRKCKELTVKMVQTLTVGQKDTNKSLFSLWYEIFSLPRAKQ